MDEHQNRKHPTASALASLLIVLVVFCTGIWFGIALSKKQVDKNNANMGADTGAKSGGPSRLGSVRDLSSSSTSSAGSVISRSAGVLNADTIADVASKASHYVVNIEVMFAHQPETPDLMARPHTISGSGVVYTADGYILTSAHLLRPGGKIKVTLDDGRAMIAKIVGQDTFTDLAVWKIEAANLPVAEEGDSSKLRPGDWAIAIGSPLGFDHTVTFGIISAIGRSLNDLNNHSEMIQTDAAINVGNSGGPLLNIQGQVIGINAAVKVGAQNISFSVPINTARAVAAELMEHGKIARPFLGFYIEDIDTLLANTMNLPSASGVLIRTVINDGPSHRGGLLPLDIVQNVNGTPVHTAKELRSLIASHKPGDVLTFTIQRKTSVETRKVTVGDFPSQ